MISFATNDHLGSNNYFYKYENKSIKIISDFKNAEIQFRNIEEIDTSAVMAVLNKFFMMGDRTLIRNLSRTPWMANLNSEFNDWTYYKLPSHGYQKCGPEEVGNKLFELLCEEVKGYIKSARKIGILLSGGMDSRMVAGVLHYLIQQGSIKVDKIECYTWGNEDSRDVVYSKIIAKELGWEWHHYKVGSEDLWNNIKIAGIRGCEYTGFHLHAIPQISEKINVEVVLAGSYGDSVGRAEYSGSHVTKLRPLDKGITNPAFLLKEAVYRKSLYGVKDDLDKYHQLFPRDKKYQQLEVDYQCHYMRRMLNPCMELINEKVPFYQAFTSPKVFGYMWSLDPACRNNEPYKFLLQKLDPLFSEIPWARTGKRYQKEEDIADGFKKKHHSYEKYVQVDLIDKIKDKINSNIGEISKNFNRQSVNKLINLVRTRTGYNFDYLERLLWLTSFAFFLEEYGISLGKGVKSSTQDFLNANVLLPLEYNLKRAGRKLKSHL